MILRIRVAIAHLERRYCPHFEEIGNRDIVDSTLYAVAQERQNAKSLQNEFGTAFATVI